MLHLTAIITGPTQTSEKEVCEAWRRPAVDIDRRYSICTATLLKLYAIKPADICY